MCLGLTNATTWSMLMGHTQATGTAASMTVGDRVRVMVSFPKRPAGSIGTIIAVERPFLTVKLVGGRLGYYGRHQLEAGGSARGA
jgi:hypothetical protein